MTAEAPLEDARLPYLLMRHRAVIEQTVFTRVSDLFGLDWTVTLYDLTNTFFEGAAVGNPKAQRGHSKEKRCDCPLNAGAGAGWQRLCAPLPDLRRRGDRGHDLGRHAAGLGRAALVVIDAGIATADNILWRRTQG